SVCSMPGKFDGVLRPTPVVDPRPKIEPRARRASRFFLNKKGDQMKTIITGGAGFIGSNAASRCLKRGEHVVIIDNLCREGVRRNLEWLQTQGPLEFWQLDMRDAEGLRRIFCKHCNADRVLHLAGQVAV